MKELLKVIFIMLGVTVNLFKVTVLAENIPVYLDNQKIELENDVFIENGRTMVPVRAICEALGYDVTWYNNVKRIFISKPSQFSYVLLKIDSFEIDSFDGKKTIDVAPKIIEGRTYIPLRILVELLGDNITWNGDLRAVYISKNPKYSGIESCNVYEKGIECSIPQIVNPSDGENKINEYFKDRLTNEVNFINSEKSKVEVSEDKFLGKYCYEIKNNKNNILSVFSLRNIYVLDIDNGGLDDDKCFFDTFYKDTGKRLQIEDILEGTKEDIEKQICYNVYKKIGNGGIIFNSVNTPTQAKLIYDASSDYADLIDVDNLLDGANLLDEASLSITDLEKIILNTYDFYIEDDNLVIVLVMKYGSEDGNRPFIATFKLNIVDDVKVKQDFFNNFGL